MVSKHPIPVILFWLLLSLVGCINLGDTQQQTMFYALEPLPATPRGIPMPVGANELALGIGPVTLPKYLDRPQIFTRIAPHQYHMEEFAQWTQNLRDNFNQVLAENLSTLLATNRVAIFPWGRAIPIDYQVIVEVISFEHHQGQGTVFHSRWRVLEADGDRVLASKRSEFKTREGSADYQAIVADLSKLLGELSKEIAMTILSL